MSDLQKNVFVGIIGGITLITVLYTAYLGLIGVSTFACLTVIAFCAVYTSVLEAKGVKSGLIGLLESISICTSLLYAVLLLDQFKGLF